MTEGRVCEDWVGGFRIAADPAWWRGWAPGSVRDLRRAEERQSEEGGDDGREG